MREAHILEEAQRGRTGQYAEDGALAQDERKGKHARKAGERSRSGAAHEDRS